MEVLSSLFYFIVAIGLLVAIHEFGHFWVARKTGVKVVRFSIGFGKVIWKYQKDRASTEYVLSAIPLGGYVKMVDEREGDVSAEDLPYAFTQKSLWARTAIVAAGPVFNLMLAVILYWAVFMLGETGMRPIVGSIETGTLAAQAGFVEGEEIVAVNNIKTVTWRETMETLLASALDAEEGLPIEVKTEEGAFITHILVIPLAVSQEPKRLFTELGLKAWQPVIPPVVGRVIENSVAAQSGLQIGDLILSADGSDFTDWIAWVKYVQGHAGQKMQVQIERDGLVLMIDLTPDSVIEQEQIIGKIGVGVQVPEGLRESLMVEHSLPPVEALIAAVERTWYYSGATLKMMGQMFVGKASVENLSGPISIAQYAGKSAEMGLISFLKFLAIVSVSLGVLNLLPIPVLDGGHLLMFAVEAIKGSPVADSVQLVFQQIGMTALLALMALAMFVDIERLFQ
ncbi:regulator of sigma E protease [Bathymodiolus platifrons methanotrophic gill symbiont]|uniref:RIP metalloprotease RseP n=1 Tax=Bathymodiolus platifrons methanotrophic gill symbiont TaxID=113268 RepID=UPI000B41BD62|nr:RIP metalloprotease RseP [Bathymodiolus platifrons methanotrophic gill symbiont]MCK5869369.1 RIP metalloprotease RseP [Methyloprofundus sp.]TXK95053.1 RIP metalloprotease RseP [Methylococcaceae bacterium CS4]TXK96101.1 RIP metalloprotease RseP [Methylococcaceae bacterium CS5]TXL06120.1 RIP metalloprotease RseP [Methylococcaceae bacterium CS3]TXL08270.1 RIP metalloprotease RseP [Methylococcaceae bacterium CS1]TXL10043.1 RIP metalloprotease RseP [Methylococcaceae bacterium CS2]TXL21225.1 RI